MSALENAKRGNAVSQMDTAARGDHDKVFQMIMASLPHRSDRANAAGAGAIRNRSGRAEMAVTQSLQQVAHSSSGDTPWDTIDRCRSAHHSFDMKLDSLVDCGGAVAATHEVRCDKATGWETVSKDCERGGERTPQLLNIVQVARPWLLPGGLAEQSSRFTRAKPSKIWNGSPFAG
jgi:hypothetical protein